MRLARDVVGYTRRTSRRYNRARSSPRDLFIDVYSNVLALGCVLMMAASLVLALREEIAGRSGHAGSLTEARWQVLPADSLWALLTLLAWLGILLAARRLGPVTVSRAEGAWWLPLPIDRRPMVLPAFRRRLLAVGAAAAVAYVPFSILTAVDLQPWMHAVAAATFGGGAVLAVSTAAILQLYPAGSGALRSRILAGSGAVAVLLFLAPPVLSLVLTLGGGSALASYALSRAGEVPGAELERGGAVSGHVGASIFFLDLNELRRAVASGPRAAATTRGSRFYSRPVRGAFAAVVRADAVAFLRLQSAPVAPLVWLGICLAAALITPALPVLLQLGVILIAGCVTTAGTGTVARRTAVIPELEALLPVSPVLVRCSRMLMPSLAMAAWMGLLAAALAALGAGPSPLVLLGALAGVGMGAGAVRAATRPPTDWTSPPVETPFGSVPRDQVSSLLRGTDMTVLAMLPMLLALYLGVVHPGLIIAQCIASAVAVSVQASSSR
ncbi:hypothetical protein FDK12_04040 [Arthrobacter sp. NamB2]|nr:hypothetical protein FDK12_04040 [Arthrobacter sp. NamB2]